MEENEKQVEKFMAVGLIKKGGNILTAKALLLPTTTLQAGIELCHVLDAYGAPAYLGEYVGNYEDYDDDSLEVIFMNGALSDFNDLITEKLAEAGLDILAGE